MVRRFEKKEISLLKNLHSGRPVLQCRDLSDDNKNAPTGKLALLKEHDTSSSQRQKKPDPRTPEGSTNTHCFVTVLLFPLLKVKDFSEETLFTSLTQSSYLEFQVAELPCKKILCKILETAFSPLLQNFSKRWTHWKRKLFFTPLIFIRINQEFQRRLFIKFVSAITMKKFHFDFLIHNDNMRHTRCYHFKNISRTNSAISCQLRDIVGKIQMSVYQSLECSTFQNLSFTKRRFSHFLLVFQHLLFHLVLLLHYISEWNIILFIPLNKSDD